MAEFSKIEWTDHTFNPWEGCTKVSAGCKHCYAEARANRFKSVTWGPTGQRRRTSAQYWKQPLLWNKKAKAAGKRARVLCASLADVFEDKPDQPELEEWRFDLLRLIVATPYLDWLLLTKRIENVRGMVPWFRPPGTFGKLPYAGGGFPENVWIGTSVENQEQADKRIPELLNIPAKVRFLSMEPLLGPVDLWGARYANPNGGLTGAVTNWPGGVGWVIVGGESGSQARPMHPDWVRGIRDECAAAGVPFFFKQWGEWLPYDAEEHKEWVVWHDDDLDKWRWLTVDGYESPAWRRDLITTMIRIGKKNAGRLLDGRTWDQFPEDEQYRHHRGRAGAS